MAEFLARLKQRKLVQWALAYIAASFALIQVLDVVASRFDWPAPLERSIILALAVGFVIALVIAWYHGEKGRQRVSGPELLLIALVLAIGGGAVWYFGRGAAEVACVGAGHAGDRSCIPAEGRAHGALPQGAAPILAQAIPAKSVAVLPFVNESGEKDQQYFSDGLSEDLITTLSQFGELKVISRDSLFRFRNSSDSSAAIGVKLGVAHLLEGSVQRAGDQVRISVELVNTADGRTLWSQRYDRPYKDLFALQDDITKAVIGALQAKLLTAPGTVAQSDRPPNGSLAAYNDLLQGRFYGSRDSEADARKAIGYFESAVRLDPHYALAWAGLASINSNLAGDFLGGSEAGRARDQAHEALRTALSLGPDLAFVHEVSAKILSGEDHDWKRAEVEAERAYQLEPDKAFFALARMRATLGHAEQAVALIRQGLPADPLCAVCYCFMGFYLAALGRFDEAIQANRKAIELQPTYDYARVYLVYIEVMRGDAQAALQAAQQVSPGGQRDQAMAMALTLGGDRAAADAALQAVIAKQSGYAAYQIAEIYALRRDPDNLFKWLQRANVNRDGAISYLLTDPPVLRYKNDPRFAAFCKKVGLPTTTDAKALP